MILIEKIKKKKKFFFKIFKSHSCRKQYKKTQMIFRAISDDGHHD